MLVFFSITKENPYFVSQFLVPLPRKEMFPLPELSSCYINHILYYVWYMEWIVLCLHSQSSLFNVSIVKLSGFYIEKDLVSIVKYNHTGGFIDIFYHFIYVLLDMLNFVISFLFMMDRYIFYLHWIYSIVYFYSLKIFLLTFVYSDDQIFRCLRYPL